MSLSPTNKKDKIEPRRLELSLNPEDGSLLTAPLSRVLIAATDGLYTDLYNVAHGEIATTQVVEDDDQDATAAAAAGQQKKEKMSSLSFAQRRHELSWRLAQHAKSLTHVAALTAAATSTEMAHATAVSTRALQHARTAWVQADEAQDALYFFHAQLFPARQAPHDVYGALDLLLHKKGDVAWKDLPADLKLVTDRYESSQEYKWSAKEVKERWHMAVRDKLIRGEVAVNKRDNVECLWKVSLNGGIVRLTYGQPKQLHQKQVYPLEAHLTVLSTDFDTASAPWTLLSVEVRAQPKTGESNHQLDTTMRQRFDLHRLCAKAMSQEEDRADDKQLVARPLHCLFSVAHNFSLSWRLEILNAQAQSMRRGVWSASMVEVTPVEFFTEGSVLGVLSISFWSVDDRYGAHGTSLLHVDTQVSVDDKEKKHPPKTNQLTLSIQAVSSVGIQVLLSGGDTILARAKMDARTRTTVQKLIDAASNTFALSASNTLLAATTLCAEQRCHSMVQALFPASASDSILPSWMHLAVDSGSIAVSARVSYELEGDAAAHNEIATILLFRMACDARSGTFVPTFCRSAKMLRLLASNDIAASETMALRSARLAQNRRRSALANATGRLVREAFDGLSRSMNVLGKRSGVGGPWLDKDDMSASLRNRAIQGACKDAKNSLTICCGMAAIFGLSALALGVATGVSAEPDLCGGPIKPEEEKKYLHVPPVGVILDQNMVSKEFVTNDGEKKKQSFVERTAFALTCTADEAALVLHAFNVTVTVDSPSSIPVCTSSEKVYLKPAEDGLCENEEPAAKRIRMDNVSSRASVGASMADSLSGISIMFAQAIDL